MTIETKFAPGDRVLVFGQNGVEEVEIFSVKTDHTVSTPAKITYFLQTSNGAMGGYNESALFRNKEELQHLIKEL